MGTGAPPVDKKEEVVAESAAAQPVTDKACEKNPDAEKPADVTPAAAEVPRDAEKPAENDKAPVKAEPASSSTSASGEAVDEAQAQATANASQSTEPTKATEAAAKNGADAEPASSSSQEQAVAPANVRPPQYVKDQRVEVLRSDGSWSPGSILEVGSDKLTVVLDVKDGNGNQLQKDLAGDTIRTCVRLPEASPCKQAETKTEEMHTQAQASAELERSTRR